MDVQKRQQLTNSDDCSVLINQLITIYKHPTVDRQRQNNTGYNNLTQGDEQNLNNMQFTIT